jgi:hypothetical protein
LAPPVADQGSIELGARELENRESQRRLIEEASIDESPHLTNFELHHEFEELCFVS